MGNWIEGKALDAVVVRIFQDSFELLSPNDHRLVGTSTCELFTIAAVSQTINCIFVAYKIIDLGFKLLIRIKNIEPLRVSMRFPSLAS